MAEYIDRNLIEWYGCNFENDSCKNRECSSCSHAECSHSQVMQIPTANVIHIPEGATNGDMIKAMFPNADIKSYVNLSGMRTVSVDFKDNMFGGVYSEHIFSKEWWNMDWK